MSLHYTLPMGEPSSVKDKVFTILTKESPLKIIQLTNIIKKRYGKSVTFQAVRKAILELKYANVLIQTEKEFAINDDWVRDIKKHVDSLYDSIFAKRQLPNSFDSIGEDVSVFHFNSLNELMKFWQDFIDHWVSNFKKGEPNINCFQGAHAWEGLSHLDREKDIMSRLKKTGIKSYTLSMGVTLLDQHIWRFYKSIGVNTLFRPPTSTFDKSYYVGTYGEWVIQTIYPDTLVKDFELYFKENTSLENLDLKKLSDIANKKIPMKLTMMKNLAMAKQINGSIMTKS